MEDLQLKRDKWLFWTGERIHFDIPAGATGPVHAIGDSHVNILTDVFPEMFISTRYASVSAYALADKKQNEFHLYLSRIPEGSKMLAFFGEIDCRHYVPRFSITKNRTIEDLISEIIHRYTTNFLSLLKERYRLIVLSPYVTPEDHYHNFYNSEEVYSNPYHMIFEAKELFHKKLKPFCEEEGIVFVPLFEEGQKGKWDTYPIGTYFNDGSHLGPCMIPIILNCMSNFKWKGWD